VCVDLVDELDDFLPIHSGEEKENRKFFSLNIAWLLGKYFEGFECNFLFPFKSFDLPCFIISRSMPNPKLKVVLVYTYKIAGKYSL
jgi:hypothetical protein